MNLRLGISLFETLMGIICVVWGALHLQWMPILAGLLIFLCVGAEVAWLDLRERQREILNALTYVAQKD